MQFATLTTRSASSRRAASTSPAAQFRAGGSYPAPAFDNVHNRLDVLIADIRGPYAQMYLYSLKPDLTLDFTTQIPGGAGDHFMGELVGAPNGRLDASYWDRSYSANAARRPDVCHERRRRSHVAPGARDSCRTTTRRSGASRDGTGFRPFIGDYNGIASTNTTAYMTWTGIAPPQPYNLEIEFATATP